MCKIECNQTATMLQVLHIYCHRSSYKYQNITVYTYYCEQYFEKAKLQNCMQLRNNSFGIVENAAKQFYTRINNYDVYLPYHQTYFLYIGLTI